ncbi:hypothetical protein O181_077030, partial [Austropuccinia psidii MF-1]|nr:hypothetical protein [Austropuccinia psidii MF-1]
MQPTELRLGPWFCHSSFAFSIFPTLPYRPNCSFFVLHLRHPIANINTSSNAPLVAIG